MRKVAGLGNTPLNTACLLTSLCQITLAPLLMNIAVVLRTNLGVGGLTPTFLETAPILSSSTRRLAAFSFKSLYFSSTSLTLAVCWRTTLEKKQIKQRWVIPFVHLSLFLVLELIFLERTLTFYCDSITFCG